MQTLNTRLFQGKEYALVIYNGQALVNKAFRFYTVVDCVDVPYEETDFDFPEYVSSYLRVYNERRGTLLVDLVLTRDGSYLIANSTLEQMTFDQNGKYYYEVGYRRGPYEQTLRYGKLNVI